MHQDIRTITGRLSQPCLYGENAWQGSAGLYQHGGQDPLALDRFTHVQGGPPSYNGYCDLDRALQTATHIAAGFKVNFGFVPRIAVGVKHGNACGASFDYTRETEEGHRVCTERMVEGDPLALFGGLVMVTYAVDGEVAGILLEHKGKRVLDGVVAPRFTDEAKERLKRRNDKCRLFENGELMHLSTDSLDVAPRFRYVRGGFLSQPNYAFVLDLKDPRLQIVGESPSRAQQEDTVLAWAVCATSNSNTISLAKDGRLIANAVGQQSRVAAVRLACDRAQGAKHEVAGAVACSDSFFPFTDGPELLLSRGVAAVLATSGSVNDAKVRAVFEQAQRTLVWGPDATMRGFFGH